MKSTPEAELEVFLLREITGFRGLGVKGFRVLGF